jgi:ABC-2 type transport system ATP-binding protein
MNSSAVATAGLTKAYPGRTAVNHLTMELPAGRVTGFVGPNGAGKTTTIRMLLGLIKPTAGQGTVLGEPLQHPERYLARVGAMIEGPAFYPTMSGRRNLQVLAKLGRIPEARVDAVLETVDLVDRQHDAFRSYSLGMKQRLGLAAGLLPDPELLILDEPTNGLDPAGIRDMRATLRSLADSGVTVLVSSHLLAEVEAMSDHLILIDGGELKYQGSVEGLTSTQQVVIHAIPEDPGQLAALLALGRAGGAPAEIVEGAVHLTAPATWAAWLNRSAFAHNITLTTLTTSQPTLEEAFLAMTATEGQEAA